ncbi:MAG: Peptidase protein [Patescibacteria group bacterium]|nr:Peptidase protein [Patescibacteria group bacterium]
MRSKYKKTLALALAALAVFSETAVPAMALEADSMSFVGIRKSRTAKILDNFKDKQEELLFDNTPFMLGEESGLFDSQARVQTLEKVLARLENAKSQYQERKIALQSEKVTLRNMLKRLDASIETSMGMIRDTEINIVKGNRNISELQTKISDLKKKIEANRKVILEYLTYVYSRGDLVYAEDQDVDLLKSMILNDGNFSDILNDIHYKSLLETAGQNFIEIRRDLVRQYYLDTEELQKEKIANLRYKTALRDRRKELESQRAYKEQLLRITQGKEALFNRYIMEKTAREKELINHIDDIESSAETLFQDFATRYGCVPVSKSGAVSESDTASQSGSVSSSGNTSSENTSSGELTTEAGSGTVLADSKKCREVRQFFEAEKTLKDSTFLDETGNTNPFVWPIEPRYISSYYHDQSYYDSIGSDHEAIDIPAEQGSDIVAPADGYVYFVNPPVEGGYGYVALKHTNGFLTIYGHVSEVMAERFQFVKAGEIFAKSGGAPGTPGAGVMTSGAHLHFEVHRNRDSIDPLRYLDITHLRYETLDAKYSYKYVQDLKARYGRRANLSGYSTFHIVGADETERQKYLLDNYAAKNFKNWDVWTEEGVEGKIDPSFLMCVGLAETGLGKNLKTAYNVGNVGNTDSGGTYDFVDSREGIYWMTKTLNNKYLGKHQGVNDLSRWGNKG